MKYILNYNDEHLSLRLCAGPVDEKTAQKKLKELAIDSMVKHGAAENAEDAEAIYEDAASDDFDTFASVVNILSLSETVADVRYNGSYSDRYEIVDYEPDA